MSDGPYKCRINGSSGDTEIWLNGKWVPFSYAGRWVTEKVVDELNRLHTEKERYEQAYFKQSHEIEQVLGEALGFPRLAADRKNFGHLPVDDPTVCVGELVPVDLVAIAAERLAKSELTDAEIEAGVEAYKWHRIPKEFGVKVADGLPSPVQAFREAVRKAREDHER
jgi:hypothetical protein